MQQSAWGPVVLLSLIVSPAMASEAQPALSEAEALQLFLRDSPHGQRVPLASREAEATLRGESLLANPRLAYEVEDAAGVRDEFLSIEQEIPLRGSRRILSEAAGAAANAARLSAEGELLDKTHALRVTFHEVIFWEQHVALLEEGRARLREVVDILAAREKEGESAGYDLLRAEQEVSELELELSEAAVALVSARARFASFFAPSMEMRSRRLRGRLEPQGPLPEEGKALERALSQRRDIRALRADSEQWRLRERAALRQRFPEPTISAGWKRSEALGVRDTGFIASVVVPLPVFDRGQQVAARAAASRALSELNAEITERAIRAEVRAALAQEKAARQAAEHHGPRVEARSTDLREIAELAYEEGESGILELLDAYRTSLAAERRALDLRFAAKHAELRRERVTGKDTTP